MSTIAAPREREPLIRVEVRAMLRLAPELLKACFYAPVLHATLYSTCRIGLYSTIKLCIPVLVYYPGGGGGGGGVPWDIPSSFTLNVEMYILDEGFRRIRSD